MGTSDAGTLLGSICTLVFPAVEVRGQRRMKTAIPTKVGDPSPIKYVIYIIMENRTYDQIFGDLGVG